MTGSSRLMASRTFHSSLCRIAVRDAIRPWVGHAHARRNHRRDLHRNHRRLPRPPAAARTRPHGVRRRPSLFGIIGSLVGYFVFTKVLGIGDDDKFDLGGIIGAVDRHDHRADDLARRRRPADRSRSDAYGTKPDPEGLLLAPGLELRPHRGAGAAVVGGADVAHRRAVAALLGHRRRVLVAVVARPRREAGQRLLAVQVGVLAVDVEQRRPRLRRSRPSNARWSAGSGSCRAPRRPSDTGAGRPPPPAPRRR